jgi:release factor glutamine methyltransferase
MTVHFLDMPFATRRGCVFTPRPATERLVEAAIARIGEEPARVADVGTGSGAIAVALATRAPRTEVWASDSSEHAVSLAEQNARALGVGHRVHVRAGCVTGGARSNRLA